MNAWMTLEQRTLTTRACLKMKKNKKRENQCKRNTYRAACLVGASVGLVFILGTHTYVQF